MPLHTIDVNAKDSLLECEKLWIFALLITAAGFLGGYTYSVRGGVFCNAQTANFVIFSMALAQGEWGRAAYFLIPMSGYMLGIVLSELLPTRIKRFHILRWDTALVGFECLVLFLLGFVPDSWPYQIAQVIINFLCAMQYNTFRQAEKIPMATTFVTNHYRQFGVFMAKYLRHRDDPSLRHRSLAHLLMLVCFCVGVAMATLLSRFTGGRAIWGAVALLLIVFVDLAHADRTIEKEMLDRKPAGH